MYRNKSNQTASKRQGGYTMPSYHRPNVRTHQASNTRKKPNRKPQTSLNERLLKLELKNHKQKLAHNQKCLRIQEEAFEQLKQLTHQLEDRLQYSETKAKEHRQNYTNLLDSHDELHNEKQALKKEYDNLLFDYSTLSAMQGLLEEMENMFIETDAINFTLSMNQLQRVVNGSDLERDTRVHLYDMLTGLKVVGEKGLQNVS